MTEGQFSYELAPDSSRVFLHGDLDEPATRELRNLIVELTDSSTRDLTIDLSGVEFLPSSAVGVLAKATDDARQGGSGIALVAADGSIAQRVLRICGLPYLEG